MQWLAHSLLAVYLFILFISFGNYFLGTELQNGGVLNSNNNGILQRTLPMSQLNDTYAAGTRSLSTGSGFNSLFIFGDPLLGASQFFNLISGGFVVQMEQKMSFPQSFQIGTQVSILGFAGTAALIYYLSNRA